MIRAFVDASVLFAAVVSRTGGARDLMRRSITGEVELLVSDYVVAEVKGNLARKAPRKHRLFNFLINNLNLVTVNPTRAQVLMAAAYTELKDAPVVAAAIAGKCEYLVTFDRQHLLDKPTISQQSGLNILTAGSLLQVLRGD